MKYFEFTFDTHPCTETVNDVLAAVLGEAGFESFVEREGGLTAYIQQSLYNEETLKTELANFPVPDTEISYFFNLGDGRFDSRLTHSLTNSATFLIAADVNGEKITQSSLNAAVDMQRRQLIQQFGKDFDASLLDDKLLRQASLDSLVDRTLLLQGEAGIEKG